MKNFIKVEVKLASAADAEVLLAALSDYDFYAFEQDENRLTAYAREEDFDEIKMITHFPASAQYQCLVIEDRNWNEEWELNFQPVIVNDFVGIRASFHPPIQNVAYELVITPKMSFGTGHHATTYLMISLMQQIDFREKKVLDFGTGTGILSILAEKMGADSVTGIDVDEWSIANAMENIQANHCKRIFICLRDTIVGLAGVNILLANINFNVLNENAADMALLATSGTRLIISGFLWEDEEAIHSVFAKYGFIKRERSQKEDWIAISFEFL